MPDPFDIEGNTTDGAYVSPRARSGMLGGDPAMPGGEAASVGASGVGASGVPHDDDDPTVVLPTGAAAGQANGPAPGQGTIDQAPSSPGVPPSPSGAAQPPVEAIDIDRAREFQRMIARRPSTPDEVFLVAAAPLLTLMAQLRHMVDFADVAALRRRVVEEIDRFENRAGAAGAQANEIMAARYVLCAVLDETVLNKPWGSRSDWSVNSLLNQFHGETWGGEKVFTILERARNEPSKYLNLLRLIDMCLSLGFEGRYRVIDGGRDQLETLRRDVGRAITDQIGRSPATLSTEVQGVHAEKRLRTFVPLWLVFAATGVILLLCYLGVQYWAGTAINPLIDQIDQIAL